MNEDAPVNNAGSGNIAGIGVGPKGEPGIGKKAKPRLLRRKEFEAQQHDKEVKAWTRKANVTEETFAGAEVFDVSPDVFYRSTFGKKIKSRYKTYVGDCQTGQKIRQYGTHWKTRNEPIILRNKESGFMQFLKGKKIDEVSNELLNRYVDKAEKSIKDKQKNVYDTIMNRTKAGFGYGSTSGEKKVYKKIANREKNVDKALSRIKKRG